jgi:threonine/homoserine/homoserine lactone efflux protein
MRELLLGVTLGLGAGVAPGPLLALVIRAALEHGAWAGVRVALAPLLTDAPIIALCLLVVDALPGSVVAALSIAGGLFVVWLGVADLRTHPDAQAPAPAGSLVRRAITINVLNPAPWVFWIGVGAPILTDSGSLRAASAFVIAFYATLVGVKATVATLVAAGRRRLLAGRGYAIALRGAALLMVATGVVLVVDGVRSL